MKKLIISTVILTIGLTTLSAKSDTLGDALGKINQQIIAEQKEEAKMRAINIAQNVAESPGTILDTDKATDPSDIEKIKKATEWVKNSCKQTVISHKVYFAPQTICRPYLCGYNLWCNDCHSNNYKVVEETKETCDMKNKPNFVKIIVKKEPSTYKYMAMTYNLYVVGKYGFTWEY